MVDVFRQFQLYLSQHAQWIFLSSLLTLGGLLFPLQTLSGEQDLADLLPKDSSYGLLVQQLGGDQKVLMSHQADQLMVAASTQKLITALGARLILPANFRFRTRLTQTGPDLVLHFGGNPMLDQKALKALLAHVAPPQSKAVTYRDIWIDDSHFGGRHWPLGNPWENLSQCYSAPSGSVIIDRNCVIASASMAGAPGETIQVTLTGNPPIQIETNAKIVTVQDQFQRHCNLDLDSRENNHYELNGCFGQRKQPLRLKIAIQNPSRYAQDLVSRWAKELGIKFSGRVRLGTPPGGEEKTLKIHQSPSLTALLDRMLKRSDNMIADNLLKAMGQHHFNQPGTYLNGLIALREVIKEKTGIDLGRAILEDGSGLSRNNRISPRLLGRVLTYIGQHEKQLHLVALLPVSGESGTLRYRGKLARTPLKGHFQAKTGTLYGAKNLAGIFTTASGQKLVVVQFINNYFPGLNGRKGSHLQFESSLYKDLMHLGKTPSPTKMPPGSKSKKSKP